MRTKLLVAVVLCACGPVDEREASVEPTAEVHQALSTVHLPVTNLGTAAGRCFSEAIPPYGTVAAAAWDTGIDCATPRTWDATPYTGLLAVPASDSLRSRATSMSHAMQIKGTGVGLVLDSRSDGIDDARNPNAKMLWFAPSTKTRVTYPYTNDPYLFPWHSAYGGTNPSFQLSFDALVKQSTTFSGVVASHATISLQVLEKTTGKQFYLQCKIYINPSHPTKPNTTMIDSEGTGKPMAISLLGSSARYCNVLPGSPSSYQTAPWASPTHYDLRFTWGHLQNAIDDLNADPRIRFGLPKTRDTYRVVSASLNLELGMGSGSGTGRAGLISGQYANWSIATVP